MKRCACFCDCPFEPTEWYEGRPICEACAEEGRMSGTNPLTGDWIDAS